MVLTEVAWKLSFKKNRGSRHFALTGHEETDSQDNIRRDDFFYMNGEQVFNFTVDRVPKLIDETLSKTV